MNLPRGHTTNGSLATLVASLCATASSTLLAYNVAPSSTILNQAMAVIGWGMVVVTIFVGERTSPIRIDKGLVALLSAIGTVIVACLLAVPGFHQAKSMALSEACLLSATAVMAVAGATIRNSDKREAIFAAFCWAWILAGLLSVAIGCVQVFSPDLADGNWVARTGFVGRAVGNLRQPNHLSSLLLWSAVAAIWLSESRALAKPLAVLAYAVLVAGIVMSASRTGLVGLLLLLGWGVCDRRLSRFSRSLLLATPVIYSAAWLSLAIWASNSHHVFGAEARLTLDGDLSSSRFGIWANTLTIIADHPWAGVGVGGFNFAWTLTPFPHRPVAFFDHTHNIVLQFIVELGLPLGLLVVALLAYALWRAFRLARSSAGPESAAFMMVLMMVLHSQLEYPLWYAYFLLPAALAFGICLSGAGCGSPLKSRAVVLQSWLSRGLTASGLAVAVGGIVMLVDYMRVAAIFEVNAESAPLEQRIQIGQRSLFFSHHADYAAVTTARRPSDAMKAFEGATHYLLDTRLMLAWANAYAERGDMDRARHLAARLREFHNEKSDEFFAQCDRMNSAQSSRPFQCDPPSKPMGPADFR